MTGGFYIVIPMMLVNDHRVSAKAKICFGVIANLCNKFGYCFATNKYIADVMDVHEITVSKYIKELIDFEWLIPENETTKTGIQRRLLVSENAKGGLAELLRGG